MGRVYLARDRLLERQVAIKILREQYAEDEQLVERFRREARSVAALSHPNIVSIYDLGRSANGAYYIAMEHVGGGTLADRVLNNGPLEAYTALEVASQVAQALAAAHEQGIVHRDIKPHNVLVTEAGDVKVADFGLARAASQSRLSANDTVMGTAAYMAPEQALGQEVEPAGDLYSLGVVLYEMLTGEVPFTSTSPTAVLLKHVGAQPEPPTTLQPSVPEGADALLARVLAKDPERRYQSAAELIEDLQRLRDGLGPSNADVAGAAAGVMWSDGPTNATLAADSRARAHAHPNHRRRTVRRLATVLLALLILLGSAGWLMRPADEPGVAGSLEGVPGMVGGAVDGAIENASGALGPAAEELGGPASGSEEGQVPEVTGMSEEAATERLDRAGFESEVRPRQSSAAAAGLALEQSIAAGGTAEEGSTILLAVGAGPPQSAQQPDVSSQGAVSQGAANGREAWSGTGGGADASAAGGSSPPRSLPAGGSGADESYGGSSGSGGDGASTGGESGGGLYGAPWEDPRSEGQRAAPAYDQSPQEESYTGQENEESVYEQYDPGG